MRGAAVFGRRAWVRRRRRLAEGIAARFEVEALGAASGTSLIGGKYEMLRPLGGGSRLSVASDRLSGRRVVLERLSAPGPTREPVLARARELGALDHGGIVKLLECIQDGAGVCVSREWVDGRSVAEILEAQGKLPLDSAVGLLRPVCQALSFAHSKGMPHGDLRPSNMLLGKDGRVVLTGFRLAAREGPAAGESAPYAAPEHPSGFGAAAGDVYALGACLYKLATGKLPFEGAELQRQKTEMRLVLPTKAEPGLPKHLDVLVLLALQPDPSRRVKSAAEFLAMLEGRMPAAPRPAGNDARAPEPRAGAVAQAAPSSAPAEDGGAKVGEWRGLKPRPGAPPPAITTPPPLGG